MSAGVGFSNPGFASKGKGTERLGEEGIVSEGTGVDFCKHNACKKEEGGLRRD
jgi:hypothetical protein